MSRLTTRDALAKAASEAIQYHPAARMIPWGDRERLAKALGDRIAAEAIASGIVVDVAALADDEALVRRTTALAFMYPTPTQEWITGSILRALAAAITERAS